MSKAKPARLRASSKTMNVRKRHIDPRKEKAARAISEDAGLIPRASRAPGWNIPLGRNFVQDACSDFLKNAPSFLDPRMGMVAHPAHYNRGGIECMDVSAAMVTGWTPQAAYRLGQAHDYLFRHAHKGAPIQDLEKAVFWIQEHIRALKAEAPRGDAA